MSDNGIATWLSCGGGTENTTDGETSVSRVNMELVSDPAISEALCIDFRASVTCSVGTRIRKPSSKPDALTRTSGSVRGDWSNPVPYRDAEFKKNTRLAG